MQIFSRASQGNKRVDHRRYQIVARETTGKKLTSSVTHNAI